VAHYNRTLALGIDGNEAAELVEFLKTL